MLKSHRSLLVLLLSLIGAAFTLAVPAAAQPLKIGIVVMHGKGGMPGARHMATFVSALESQGFMVANLEMPWSRKREYDVPVSRGVEEVEAALKNLHSAGAHKVFIAGHSQGGVFAMHLAGKLESGGVIAIAPGGDVSNKVFRDQLGGSVSLARQMIADGKGEEKAQFEDYEGSRGKNTLTASAAAYMTWFDPDGAMNLQQSIRAANPKIPILWIVPTGDYPGLRRTSIPLFGTLQANPLTRLYEPDSNHLNAPAASADEIVRWVGAVVAAQKP